MAAEYSQMAYPYTPPPTSSPKHDTHFHATSSSNSNNNNNNNNITTTTTTRVAAQDSYFYSVPNSPAPPSHQQVVIHQHLPLQPYQVAHQFPPHRTPSPNASGRLTPPRPIYYSPTNPVPSPYSASRPKPRLGYRKRILAKLSTWIRKMYLWAKENPIKAGIMTFIPVLALAGATRMLRSVGKMFGQGKNGMEKVIKDNRKLAQESKKAKKEGKKAWGWGLDKFVDFNCSKGGPLDGVLKILQMWVNHICRVSPSMIPRTMSIFLELYFLDIEKPF